MKIIIIVMITYIIYHIFFLLYLSVSDAKFPTIAQIWARQLWKWIAGENPHEMHQWLNMFDTSLIQAFDKPVFYSYV